jgi:hypothetical protein
MAPQSCGASVARIRVALDIGQSDCDYTKDRLFLWMKKIEEDRNGSGRQKV